MTKALLIFCLMAFIQSAHAKDYYLSLNGQDRNSGSESKPFRSFSHALNKLSANDTLIVEAGRYTQSIDITGRLGNRLKGVTIRARKGADVVLDGTDSLKSAKWRKLNKGIYVAKLDQPISQLFDDNTLLTPARWPNAHMTDSNFFNVKETNRMMVQGNSTLGTVVDARPLTDSDSLSMVTENQITDIRIRNGMNMQALSDTGVSFKNAISVMNIGSWMNFVSRITDHTAGDNTFNYDPDFSESGDKIKRITKEFKPGGKFSYFLAKQYWHPHYYFIEGLAALDVEREYWYDQVSSSIYYKPEGGNLNPAVLRGKRRSYMLKAQNCRNMTFDGLNFFGGTFSLKGCTGTTIKNTRLSSPSWNEFQIGNLGLFPRTEVINNPKNKDVNNRIENIQASYHDGEGIVIRGNGITINNCLFHHQQYTNIGFSVGVHIGGGKASHCTIYDSGAPEGFRDGIVMDSNRVSAIGGLMHDGSAFQLSTRTPTVLRNNWVHDTTKISYRYDSGRNPPFANGFGIVHNNVAWNAGRTQIKGDDHIIANNTLLGRTAGINLNTKDIWKSTNVRTVAVNNISDVIDGKPVFKTGTPGITSNNYITTDASDVLRDPANLDFRPKAKSTLIGNGKKTSPTDFSKEFPVSAHAIMPRNPNKFIGAYSADSEHYNIPGFRFAEASTPVPPHGSTTAKSDADLMWLTGYQSISSDIYFAESEEMVALANKKSKVYQGSLSNNIFHPGALNKDKDYFWRVDSVNADGTVIKGPVWKFRSSDPEPVLVQADYNEQAKNFVVNQTDVSTKIIIDGLSDDWGKLDKSEINALRLSDGSLNGSSTKAGHLYIQQHKNRQLLVLAEFPNIGNVVESSDGINLPNHHTAWELAFSLRDSDGKLSPNPITVYGFPNGTYQISAKGIGKNYLKQKMKDTLGIEYVVKRHGKGMTAEMAIDLKLLHKIFKSNIETMYFNSSIHIDAKPYHWAQSFGDAPNLIQDGLLSLQKYVMKKDKRKKNKKKNEKSKKTQ